MSLETENTLREMGLSSYEIAAYVTLLEKGKMTAKNVSEKGRIPYSKIYNVLNSLINKGWIKSDERRPNKYFPISPLEAMALTQQKLEKKLENWRNTITNELQILFERMELVERPDVLVLHGHQRIMVKLEEMIKKATKEIMIAMPEFVRRVITSTLFLQEAWKKRRLNIKFMVTKKAINWKILKELSNIAEVRSRDQMFGGGILIDAKEAMLFLGQEKPSLVIWSNHIGLSQFAREYFQFLWDSSDQCRF